MHAGAHLEESDDGTAPLELLIPVREQGELLCGWAKAALVKLQLCSCLGCAGAAMLSVHTCHEAASDLFTSMAEFKDTPQWRREWEAAGRALVATLQVHVVLLLLMHAHVSPNKARLAAATRCGEQWDVLMADGLTWHLPAKDLALVCAPLPAHACVPWKDLTLVHSHPCLHMHAWSA
jgi:hypothetical protein